MLKLNKFMIGAGSLGVFCLWKMFDEFIKFYDVSWFQLGVFGFGLLFVAVMFK